MFGMRRPSLQHLSGHVSHHQEHMLSYVKRERQRQTLWSHCLWQKHSELHTVTPEIHFTLMLWEEFDTNGKPLFKHILRKGKKSVSNCSIVIVWDTLYSHTQTIDSVNMQSSVNTCTANKWMPVIIMRASKHKKGQTKLLYLMPEHLKARRICDQTHDTEFLFEADNFIWPLRSGKVRVDPFSLKRHSSPQPYRVFFM